MPAWLELDAQCGELSATGRPFRTGTATRTGPEFTPRIVLGEGTLRERGLTDERLKSVALDLLHADEIAGARLGLGKIRLCKTLHPEEQGRNHVFMWYDRWQIDLTYSFGWCEGENKVVRLPAFVTAVVPDATASIVALNVLDAATYARQRIRAAGTGSLSDRCMRPYWARLKEKRRELIEFIGQRLTAQDELRRGNERLKAANKSIQSWISLAFDRMMGRSDVLAAIVAGRVALANIDAMLEDDEMHPWQIADEVIQSLDRVESVLRSRAVADLVAYGFGHRLLTETSFAALGDTDQQ